MAPGGATAKDSCVRRAGAQPQLLLCEEARQHRRHRVVAPVDRAALLPGVQVDARTRNDRGGRVGDGALLTGIRPQAIAKASSMSLVVAASIEINAKRIRAI